MMHVGIRPFQRRCRGWSPHAPDLRGFLCMLAWAGEATRQELRLLGGSRAFPSSPTAQAKSQTTAPLWCPAAALHKEGLRDTLRQPPGVGDLSWGERRRAIGMPRLGDRTSSQVAPQNSPKACPEEGGKKGLWLGDAQPQRGCRPHGQLGRGSVRRGAELEEPDRMWEPSSWQDNYFFNQVFSKHLILLLYSSISIAERLRWNLKGILHNSNNVSYHKRQSLSAPSCKFSAFEY